MISTLRARLTYANMTASLALFLALGGSAYAATVLPANSVGVGQLKRNAVERTKLKNNAVNASKVQDDSLTGRDIQEGSLGKVKAAAVADTATNATHAATAATAATAAALDKTTYKTETASAPASSLNTAATAACDAGQHVIGGGARVDDLGSEFMVDDYPDAANTAWTAHVANLDEASAHSFTVYAICTSVTSTG